MNDGMTIAPDGETRRRTRRITLEMVLWATVGVLALVLRLVHLGAAPLAASEAHEAMLAWRAVTGQGMPEAGYSVDYSPVLFVANSALFTLCGAGDALARLWPALLGGALALTPLLFRQRIGRVGGLAAGLYLAISPTALFASRQLDGAVLAALGGVVLLGGGLRFFEAGSRRWLVLAAVGSALAVTSTSAFYGMALALGLAWALFAWGWPAGRLRRLGRRLRPHLMVVVAVFAASVFVFAAGLGWHPAGVGAAADLFPAWFAHLGSVSLIPLASLVVYEPLGLLAGFAGWVWMMRKRRRLGVLLGLWVGFGAFFLVAVPPVTPAGMAWIVLPLALLGGVWIEAAVRRWRAVGDWRAKGLYGLVAGVLWVYLYLRFSRYGLLGNPLDLVVGIIALISPLLLLAFAALGFALVAGDGRMVTEEMIRGARNALHGAVASATLALLATTFSVGWGIAQVRPVDPRELLVYEPTAPEVRDLVQTLRDLSWRETGFPTTMPFTFEAAPDSVLAWYLRDFSAARRVEDLSEVSGEAYGTAVVTLDRQWTPAPQGETGWVGQDFVLGRSWRLSRLSCAWEWPPCNVAVEWLIRRDPTSTDSTGPWAMLVPEVAQQVVVWAHDVPE
jgi:uncharacterized protein (TIGR03663 family)